MQAYPREKPGEVYPHHEHAANYRRHECSNMIAEAHLELFTLLQLDDFSDSL